MKAAQLRVVKFRRKPETEIDRICRDLKFMDSRDPQYVAAIGWLVAKAVEMRRQHDSESQNVGKPVITIEGDDRPGA